MTGDVYLLCFAPGVPRDERASACHYIGWALDVERRVGEHLAGAGSPLVKAALARHLPVRLARTWSGVDRNFERQLKNRRNAPKLCPYCNGEHECPPSANA